MSEVWRQNPGGAVGFVCENNRRDDPESCRFMVGKVASVKIKESVLKELLQRKRQKLYQDLSQRQA